MRKSWIALMLALTMAMSGGFAGAAGSFPAGMIRENAAAQTAAAAWPISTGGQMVSPTPKSIPGNGKTATATPAPAETQAVTATPSPAPTEEPAATAAPVPTEAPAATRTPRPISTGGQMVSPTPEPIRTNGQKEKATPKPAPGGTGTAEENGTVPEATPEIDKSIKMWTLEEMGNRDAKDISERCKFNGKSAGTSHVLTDGRYNRTFETGLRDGAHAVVIEAGKGDTIGALYIQWAMNPVAIRVQIAKNGEWRTVAFTDGSFFADYIRIPECTKCRIVGRQNSKTQLRINEIRVLTAGKPADSIQQWQKPGDKVDMILISGHPDDELLWFGGALPYYAGELKKDTLVICCAMSVGFRMLELCDALWACGVRIHPIYLHRLDFTDRTEAVLAKWHAQDEVCDWITGYFRRYKPDVVLLHDVNGEYGHGVHKAASWIGTACVKQAADPKSWPDSAKKYGTWNVPKVYVHLSTENQIRMNWKRPLKAFGGKTGLQVAQEALQFHRSQVVHGWAVQDGGEYDNALFGLVHSTVGPDVEKNDFFEHIGTDPSQQQETEETDGTDQK